MALLVFFLYQEYADKIDFPKSQPHKVVGSAKSQRSGAQYPVRPHTLVSPPIDSSRAVVRYWQKYVHHVLVNSLTT